MKHIPIVFAFDNNLIEAAGVCFTSLLLNAKEDTFYEISVMHSPSIKLREEELQKITDTFPNCSLQFVAVDESFESAFEIRHVTKATYYRLLIPDLFPKYDKVIYSDVDIIFRMDLQEVYFQDMGDNYVAGALDIGMNSFEKEYVEHLGNVKLWDYIQAGFMIFNLKKMREDGLVAKFKAEAANNHTYQDQDVVNMVCAGKKMILPPCWNVNDCSYIQFLSDKPVLPDWITKDHIARALREGTMHYSGYKPWQRYSLAFDLWWEYYRKSPFFDEHRYYKFFYDKTLLLDSLTLWKRVKGVIRYFLHGRYKG